MSSSVQDSEPAPAALPKSGTSAPIKPVACLTCHEHKVKCSGGKPCSRCRRADKDCVYPKRDRQVKLSQTYVDHLVQENTRLKQQLAELASRRVSCSPTRTRDQDRSRDALFEDQPWFHPVPTLDMPILIGEAADAAFATRFRQLISKGSEDHIHRVSYVSDEIVLALSDMDCPWPSPARARFLMGVALDTVCRRYHLVRRSAVLAQLEHKLREGTPLQRLEECRVFALFALGDIYSTRVLPKDGLFPGLAYFARARKIVTIPSERPELITLEIALLLSMYSCMLNRRHSAYSFASSAIHLGIIMGMNQRIPQAIYSDKDAREHRNRVWWTAYIFDRTWAARLGHPASIQDEDVQTELPGEATTPFQVQSDFEDHVLIKAHIELARLTGSTNELIYSRRLSQRPFSQRVQDLLAKLIGWAESLPTQLQLAQFNESLPIAHPILHLHLTFNQLVILTTRPILLHLIRRKREQASPGVNTTYVQGNDSIATLAETCIRCARHSYRLLNTAWTLGSFAILDYFPTQYLFSAATVMRASAALALAHASEDLADYSNAVSILRQLEEGGNFAAKEYCGHIGAIDRVSEGSQGQRSTATPGFPPSANTMGSFSTSKSMTTSMALADPSLQDFMSQVNFNLPSLSDPNDIEPVAWTDFWVNDWQLQ